MLRSLRVRLGRISPEHGAALGMLLPMVLGLGVFTYGPTLTSLSWSAVDWDLLGVPRWVGGATFQALLADATFWQTVGQTVTFVSLVTVGQVGLGVLLALALATAVRDRWPGQALCRAATFLPVIAPMVSVSLVWGWLYDPAAGGLNRLLAAVGLPGVPWLQQAETALPAVALLAIWKTLGVNVLLCLAARQAIPESIYEAAKLDAAPTAQVLWRLTLPMMSPTLFFVSMLTLIQTFQVFDPIYLLTQGGPQHRTEVLVYSLFQCAFEQFDIGRASALAVLLFVWILTLTGLQWRLRTRWVQGEG